MFAHQMPKVNDLCPRSRGLQYHQHLTGFIGHLPLVPGQSTNDKCDNEVKPGTVHRSPDIYLQAEGTSGKPKIGDRLTKAV